MTKTRYLTLTEISKLMRIKIGTARNRLNKGQNMPPSINIGRRRLFEEGKFIRWMDDKETLNDEDSENLKLKLLIRGLK